MSTVKITEKPQEVCDANPITNSEPFKYKSSITANTSNANQEDGENTEQGNTKARKNLEIVFP